MAMKTLDEIEADLREAVRILRRTPFEKNSRPVHLRAAWPDVVREAADAYGYTKVRCRGGLPSPRELDRMDEVLGWLFWVEGSTRTVLFGRACDVSWRKLSAGLGFSLYNLRVIHQDGLAIIARRLGERADAA